MLNYRIPLAQFEAKEKAGSALLEKAMTELRQTPSLQAQCVSTLRTLIQGMFILGIDRVALPNSKKILEKSDIAFEALQRKDDAPTAEDDAFFWWGLALAQKRSVKLNYRGSKKRKRYGVMDMLIMALEANPRNAITWALLCRVCLANETGASIVRADGTTVPSQQAALMAVELYDSHPLPLLYSTFQVDFERLLGVLALLTARHSTVGVRGEVLSQLEMLRRSVSSQFADCVTWLRLALHLGREDLLHPTNAPHTLTISQQGGESMAMDQWRCYERAALLKESSTHNTTWRCIADAMQTHARDTFLFAGHTLLLADVQSERCSNDDVDPIARGCTLENPTDPMAWRLLALSIPARAWAVIPTAAEGNSTSQWDALAKAFELFEVKHEMDIPLPWSSESEDLVPFTPFLKAFPESPRVWRLLATASLKGYTMELDGEPQDEADLLCNALSCVDKSQRPHAEEKEMWLQLGLAIFDASIVEKGPLTRRFGQVSHMLPPLPSELQPVLGIDPDKANRQNTNKKKGKWSGRRSGSTKTDATNVALCSGFRCILKAIELGVSSNRACFALGRYIKHPARFVLNGESLSALDCATKAFTDNMRQFALSSDSLSEILTNVAATGVPLKDVVVRIGGVRYDATSPLNWLEGWKEETLSLIPVALEGLQARPHRAMQNAEEDEEGDEDDEEEEDEGDDEEEEGSDEEATSTESSDPPPPPTAHRQRGRKRGRPDEDEDGDAAEPPQCPQQ